MEMINECDEQQSHKKVNSILKKITHYNLNNLNNFTFRVYYPASAECCYRVEAL